MIIYRVIAYDVAHTWWHFATKREAEAKRRELLRDLREIFDHPTCEIDAVEVKPTRAGIAEALNDFVSLTCLNEH